MEHLAKRMPGSIRLQLVPMTQKRRIVVKTLLENVIQIGLKTVWFYEICFKKL